MPLSAPFTAVLAATPAPPSRPCHTRRGLLHRARVPASRSPLPWPPRNLARWLYAPLLPSRGTADAKGYDRSSWDPSRRLCFHRDVRAGLARQRRALAGGPAVGRAGARQRGARRLVRAE